MIRRTKMRGEKRRRERRQWGVANKTRQKRGRQTRNGWTEGKRIRNKKMRKRRCLLRSWGKNERNGRRTAQPVTSGRVLDLDLELVWTLC